MESEQRAEERAREKLRAAYRDSIAELLEDVRGHLLRLTSENEGLTAIVLLEEGTADRVLRPGIDRSARKAAELVPTRLERMVLRGSVPDDMFMWLTDVQRHIEGSIRLLAGLKRTEGTAPLDSSATLSLLKERLSRAVEELNYLKRALDGEKVSPPA